MLSYDRDLTFREALRPEFGQLQFSNPAQGGPRISGQPYGPNLKDELTYDEFVDSFFGTARADIKIDDMPEQDGWDGQDEACHWGYVMDDHKVKS